MKRGGTVTFQDRLIMETKKHVAGMNEKKLNYHKCFKLKIYFVYLMSNSGMTKGLLRTEQNNNIKFTFTDIF